MVETSHFQKSSRSQNALSQTRHEIIAGNLDLGTKEICVVPSLLRRTSSLLMKQASGGWRASNTPMSDG